MSEWNAFEHSATPAGAKKWQRLYMLDSPDSHVIPVNDIMPHQLSEDCPCDPDKIRFSEDNRYEFLHHAYDGRPNE